jgi:AcrR family transcriptional regulator
MKGVVTQRRIAHAARVLLAGHGADAVTMRRVAAAAGITAMAVYRHYADRDALLEALADEGFDELASCLDEVRLSGSLDSRLAKMLDTFLNFALEQPRLFELMFLAPRRSARRFPRDFASGRSPTGNRFAELIAQGIQQGALRRVDVWEVVLEAGALLQGLVMLYLGERLDVTEETFRAICHRAVGRYIDGLRRPMG